MTQTYLNYIGGRWVPAANGQTTADVNPANTGEVLAVFPSAGWEDAAQAIEAAAHAFPAWSRTPMPKRGEILHRAANLLEERANEAAEALTREEGKTFAESKGEVLRGASILRYYAGETMQPTGEIYPSASASTLLYAERVPVGVVALITPWNFPVAIPTWKLAPALAYGNTVVLKPAELTPLTAWHLVDVLEKAGLPPGVLNLVVGRGSLAGNELVENPQVKAISFTGSNEVGSKIAAQATARGAKVQLEMGGKNPTVVLADANLDQAVELTIAGAMLSTGQKCTATSRVIVQHDIADEFRDRLVARAEAIKVGDGMQPDTYMGPLVNAEAEQRVLEYVRLGQAEGARLLTGGVKLSGDQYERGYFVAPTVFDGVTPEMRIAQEEIFGPVVSLIEARDFDEAVRFANQTRFGLSASVVTRDLNLALRFVREIEAGIVHVNSQTAGAEPQVPFGGFKSSSSGSREQGKAARDFFTQIKTVYFDPL
ncbi:MAG: aldehyde dehydrogenase family protein [Chloroflexi bacterium]|nr:aldehyde dehydrogenase family protein [Chloroflexota bacterium]MCI0578210.1 aldehyde dehydrogenase family protein [Chloroflexota bacterium]MCI0645297.1 aldehyde dehydrogenase family protein [Chloroflexota bacterium]MCI0729549.1 aldehyde dehydrogenase family protein [Chloroflexota bacterium]